jgi:hypothetical protein
MVFYSIGICVGVLGIRQQYLFSKKIIPVVHKFRIWLGIFVFFLIAFGSTIVVTNILIYIFYGDTYRHTINEYYHAQRIVFGMTLLIQSATTSILLKILVPVRYFELRRQRRKQILITYLHEKLTQVVPVVRLPFERGEHSIRQLIEIGDARDILWSHKYHPAPITPTEEAELLFSLEQTNVTINEPGVYQPPVIQGDVVQHNLMVAQYLRKLEHE